MPEIASDLRRLRAHLCLGVTQKSPWHGVSEQQELSWHQRSSQMIAFHFSLLCRRHQASQQTVVSMPQEDHVLAWDLDATIPVQNSNIGMGASLV
jgi:hypothetical protein